MKTPAGFAVSIVYCALQLILLSPVLCPPAQGHEGHGKETKAAQFTKHLDESRFAVTDKGLFSVEIPLDGSALKIDEGNTAVVIHDARDEDVEGARLQVLFVKPGQDPKDQPALKVAEEGGGLYVVRKLDLRKEGPGELTVKVKKGSREDQVVIIYSGIYPGEQRLLPKGRYAAEELKK